MLERSVWDQIKAISRAEFIRALERDEWESEGKRGATLGYVKNPGTQFARRVVVHYHPRRTFSRNVLKNLLEDTGWKELDLIRLKLIRRKGKTKWFTKMNGNYILRYET